MDFRARILLSVDDMIHSKQNWQNPKSKILNSKLSPAIRYYFLLLPSLFLLLIITRRWLGEILKDFSEEIVSGILPGLRWTRTPN